MSNLTIKNLPNSVIIEILQKLDQDSLKNAALTCTLWKQLVEKYCSWSVIIYNYQMTQKWDEFYSKTERKIRQLEISGLTNIQNSRAIDLFRKHGCNIRKLTLTFGFLDSVMEIVQILKLLPNLEYIFVNRVQFTNATKSLDENDFPMLAKLETLDCVYVDCSILQCFLRSKITTLKFLNALEETKTEGVSTFLKQQTNLKTLDVHYTNLLSLKTKLPFHLTKLSLRWIGADVSDLSGLEIFMKYHARTLEELELGHNFPQHIYKFIFSSLDNLKSLHLFIYNMPKDVEFYRTLKANKNITHLTLRDFHPPNNHQENWSTLLKELFTCLPKLTSLCFLTYWARTPIPYVPKELVNKVDVKWFNGSTYQSLIK